MSISGRVKRIGAAQGARAMRLEPAVHAARVEAVAARRQAPQLATLFIVTQADRAPVTVTQAGRGTGKQSFG